MVNNLQYQLITEKIISQPPLRTGVILLKLRGLGGGYRCCRQDVRRGFAFTRGGNQAFPLFILHGWR